MTATKDSFATLERHIQLLEENVEKLSNALTHWRQWKEEYETLREDVKLLPPSASREELAKAREEFEGDLIQEKELVEIFGKNDAKKPDQIKSILTNRLDYVAKNIQTLQKQLDTARDKLAAATVISNPDAGTDDDGLPITEIREELDDDDNVISYSLRAPGGGNQAQLLETLEKLGIKEDDIPEGGPGPSSNAVENGDTSETKANENEQASSVQQAQSAAPPAAPKEAQQQKADPENTNTASKKKSVKFAEDMKSAAEEKVADSETSKQLVEILRKARDEQGAIEDPVMPADEPPEDAALREDMIRYNKETMEYEMAPIVAELNLEEGSATDTDDYSDYDDDDDDEEDQWGRSTTSVVSDDWKRQMLELKERLSRHTFGAENEDGDSDGGEGIGRISIKHEDAPSPEKLTEEAQVQDATQPPTEKKGVRFAETLDIADEAPTKTAPPPAKPAKPVVEPLSDVMERSGPKAEPTPKSSRKPSRFRMGKAREASSAAGGGVPTFQGVPLVAEKPAADQPHVAPSGPEGRTLAASVLEHEPSLEAQEPDALDAGLLHQQAAVEYHKMRNRLVHRQGGFLKEDERPVRPLDEEEGGPKRVSRFKAARLARP